MAPERVLRAAGTQRWVNREAYRPSHNVMPGAATPVVRQAADGGAEICSMRWGLVPSFTKKDDRPDFFRMVSAGRAAMLLPALILPARPTLPQPPSLRSACGCLPQFNARSETLAEKASFKRLVASRRCLVRALWQRLHGQCQGGCSTLWRPA